MASPSSLSIFGVEVKLNESIYIEIYNNPSKIYFPGQSVEGRMIVHTTRPEEVKEILIQLVGRGHVQWIEHKTTYSAEEHYVQYRHSLFGDGHNVRLLPPGTLVHPFRFDLPNDIPSSFHTFNRSGEVSYLLTGELRRPLFKINDRGIVPLTVTGRLDLNLVDAAKLPQECKKTKGTNYLCCRMGNISLELSIPTKSGFVPGEVLDFRAEIRNGSNKRITGAEAFLKQVVTFHAEGGFRVLDEVKIEVQGPEVEVWEHEIWNGSLNLPSTDLPPTGLGGQCSVIDLEYFLVVKIHIGGLSSPLKGKLPIVIGTIPLRDMPGECSLSAPGYNQVTSGLSPQGKLTLQGRSDMEVNFH